MFKIEDDRKKRDYKGKEPTLQAFKKPIRYATLNIYTNIIRLTQCKSSEIMF